MQEKGKKELNILFFILFYFVFIFILLTRMKATETLYIGQAITLACFRRCQDIAVRLKCFYFIFMEI